MTTAYTSLLGLALPVTGELSGTWGTTVNNFITSYLDAAVAGAQTISGTQTAVTLTTTNGLSLTQAGPAGGTGSAQYAIINCTGNPAGLLTITAPAASKAYLVLNSTSTSQSVKVVGAGPTTGVTIATGQAALIAWNGSDFTLVASTDLSKLSGVLTVAKGGTGATTLTGYVKGSGTSALTASATIPTSDLTGTLPVANGGTGQTTYTDGQLLIGNTATTGLSKATITAGSGVSISNGNGSITISATGSGGTITSVTASSPLASSGGTTPNISFTGVLAAANGGTGNANGTVAKVATTNFSIEESGGKLLIKYGATTLLSINSSGNVITIGNITAAGTP